MAYDVYGAEAGVEAVREFLEDGTLDSGGPADTYNGVLAERRTTLGITTAALPDVSLFETFWHRAETAVRTPHCLIAWVGNDTEQLPPTGRSYDHRIEIGIFVAEADIAGDEIEVMRAAVRYLDALRVMFHRRTAGQQGATLNNGGTGAAQGRVIHAAVVRQGYAVEGAPPNLLAVTELRVRMNEAY